MLDIWIVYDSPSDFPGQFVARRFEVNKPTADVLTAGTLEALRALLPPGLIRLERTQHDQPHIAEVWV
jgi:hypothetical protein